MDFMNISLIGILTSLAMGVRCPMIAKPNSKWRKCRRIFCQISQDSGSCDLIKPTLRSQIAKSGIILGVISNLSVQAVRSLRMVNTCTLTQGMAYLH